MRKRLTISCLSLTLALVCVHQGCQRVTSHGTTDSASDTRSYGNGQGYEGKIRYVFMDLQAPCSTLDSSGQPLPNAEVDVFGSVSSTAILARNHCADVNQVINVSDLQFSGGANTQLVYNSTTFVSANILVNPSFETVISPWYLNINHGAGTLAQDNTSVAPGGGNASGEMILTSSIGNIWDLCTIQPGFAVSANTQYTVSFWAKGDVAGRQILAAVSHGQTPFNHYIVQSFAMGTGWQQFTFTYTQSVTDGTAEFELCSGQQTGTVWIDMISITAGPM